MTDKAEELAREPKRLTYEQEVHAMLCAAAANTEDLLRYFEAQAASETGEAKCIAWKRDDLSRIRALIPQSALLRPHLGERWIPVGERLPEPKQVVLTYRNGRLQSDWYGVRKDGMGVWSHECVQLNGDVTHWRPLPAPPAEEER